MNVFFSLYSTLFPFLLCIPLGYFLTSRKILPKSFISKPLLFVLMPILVVNHVLEATVSNLTILPIITFFLSLLMIFPAIIAHKTFAGNESPSLLKSGFSFFNVAFFGIPTVQALFGKEAVTILICIYIGTALYGNIIGYFQVARTRFSRQQALREIFKVPFIYVFIFAVLLKVFDVEMPLEATPVIDIISVVVSVAGMMIIGMNIAKVNFKTLEWSYYVKVLGVRVLSAVIIMIGLMALESFLVGGLKVEEKQVLILLPFFPIAANLTVFASFLKSQEKQSALLVLLSMLISLILVPIAAIVY